MMNISQRKKISIICVAIVLLVVVTLVLVSYFGKETSLDKEVGTPPEVEENGEEQEVDSNETKEENLLSNESNVAESPKSETTQPSKDDVTESSQKEEESQEEKFEEIFEEKSETEDNSEGSSDIKDDETKEEETEEKLEDIEDTSTGYGPIS